MTIILLSGVYKLPQIYQVVKSGSTLRISVSSIVYSIIAYTVCMVYHIAFGYPLYTYAEHGVSIIQGFLLLAVVWFYREEFDAIWLIYALIYTAVCLVMALHWVPDIILYGAMMATTPILMWSKFIQLKAILLHKHSGQVNLITWLIVSYQTAVQMLLTALVTKDMLYQIQLTTSQILNLMIVWAIVYYRTGGQE